MNLSLRIAISSDADAMADLYLASRKTFLAFAPIAHTDDQVRQWIADILIPSNAITMAVKNVQIVAMMAASQEDGFGWLDQLYVAPNFMGQGIGTLMLAHAKAILGSPIRLYTFQENIKAKRFYERHGFLPIAFSDGKGNEEKCPDILYEWDTSTQESVD